MNGPDCYFIVKTEAAELPHGSVHQPSSLRGYVASLP